MSKAAPFPDQGTWRALLHAADDADSVCVAFSGGADSSALLHQLCALRQQWPSLNLRALHVDHRLHADSPCWAEHCLQTGAVLGVDTEVCVVDATPAGGESPEAAARAARYTALAARLAPGEVLISAHHADDQAETLLLQLLRGAGPEGLAAMPGLTRFAAGWLARPLLASTRAALTGYCREHGLRWLEDPANRDPRHDRSYLRNTIMPLVAERWPAAVHTIARAAAHQAAAAELLQELACADLSGFAVRDDAPLPLSSLSRLSPARRANALRLWLRLRGAPTPSSAQLAEMLNTMLEAGADAMPEVAWGGRLLRRHAGQLFLCKPAPSPGPACTAWPDTSKPLALWHGRMLAHVVVGAGICAGSLTTGEVEVRMRRGGERLRPDGDRHTRELKKMLHTSGMPPWQRAALPLLYVAGELVAVPGLCIAAGHAARPGEPGLDLHWLPHDEDGRRDDD